jgi:addiction module RelE/StbE family toxin
MRVRWTKPALRDLEAIGDYIGRNNPAAAARIVTAILDQTDALSTFPHLGRTGRIPGTRELVVVDTPFVTPYRVRDADVEILAVFHGSRRWPENLD